MINFNPFRREGRSDPLGTSVSYTYIQKNNLDPSDDPIYRDQALKFVPYYACTDLLCRQAADVISRTVRVIDDRTNTLVTTELARKACSLLRDTPDGVHSAAEFLHEVMADFLIDGNGLVEIVRGMRTGSERPIMKLCRLNTWDACADITDYTEGLSSVVYEATRFGAMQQISIPINNVIHARLLPRAYTYNQIHGRTLFSNSSLVKLRRALNIGITVDLYIKDYFDTASKSNLAIMFPDKVTDKVWDRFRTTFKKYVEMGRAPLVTTGGADVKELRHSASDNDVVKLREYQTMEIARFFKIPPPCIGVHTTQWGSGLEQLARLMWRYSTRLYVAALLREFSLKMLPRGQRFIVDPNSEVMGDTKALTALLAAVAPNTNRPASMSQKEVRQGLLGLYDEYDDDWNWQSSLDANTMPPEAKAMYERIRALQADFYKQYTDDSVYEDEDDEQSTSIG